MKFVAAFGELRKLTDKTGDQDLDIPVETLGFGDGLRSLFPDGVVRFVRGGGDQPGLSVGADGSAVGLEADLPAPGVPVHLLVRYLGFELPELPGPGLDRLGLLVRDDADPALTATGPGRDGAVMGDRPGSVLRRGRRLAGHLHGSAAVA